VSQAHGQGWEGVQKQADVAVPRPAQDDAPDYEDGGLKMQMVAPRRKKFNGHWYDFDQGFSRRDEAEQRVNHLRAGNYYARVVTITNIRGYFVYARVKPFYGR